MEFKGTKGEWEVNPEQFIYNGVRDIYEVNYNNDGECVVEIVHGLENAQLIADAGNVRQQIDCSLPELLERYKRMDEALKGYHDMAIRITMPTEQELNELALKSQLALNNK